MDLVKFVEWFVKRLWNDLWNDLWKVTFENGLIENIRKDKYLAKLNETKYSRMDQVKFVEDSHQKN